MGTGEAKVSFDILEGLEEGDETSAGERADLGEGGKAESILETAGTG